jgi:hypothetical protein
MSKRKLFYAMIVGLISFTFTYAGNIALLQDPAKKKAVCDKPEKDGSSFTCKDTDECKKKFTRSDGTGELGKCMYSDGGTPGNTDDKTKDDACQCVDGGSIYIPPEEIGFKF